MKALQAMRDEMTRRKQNATTQKAEAEEKHRPRMIIPPNPTIGRVREKTPVTASEDVRLPQRPMTKAETETLLKGGASVLTAPIPAGYRALSKNQRTELEAFVAGAQQAGVLSFDFETNADQDEGVDVLNDIIVGVSFSYEADTAIYLPIAHDSYAANWKVEDVIELFRPLWESEDILKIAYNIKFEHQILLRYGVRMPYVNVADPMIMVLMTAQFEEMALKTVVSEILPYLFDKYGEQVLSENLTAVQLDELYIDEGDDNRWVRDPDNPEIETRLDELKEAKQKKLFWDLYVTKFTDVTAQTIPDGVYKSGEKKGQQKWKKVHRSFNEMPVDRVTVDYGCKDSDWALQLYYKLKPTLEAEGLQQIHDVMDAPGMMVLGEMELNGWRVIPDRLQTMYDEANSILEGDVYPELDRELRAALPDVDTDEDDNILVPAGTWQMGTWRRKPVYLEIKTGKPFNWGSTQHLQWLFFAALGLDVKLVGRSKKTGLPSTGADEIDKLIYAHPNMNLFRTLLKKREYEKIRDTYAKSLLEKARPGTDRIHASLKLVRTWRLSCSGPNLQNIPRLDNDSIGIRKAFIADPGKVLVSCDLSQVELRFMAFFAKDANMKDAYYQNQDLHSRVAKEVFKLQCTVEEVKKQYKSLRYFAKSVNFGICFGSTEYGLYNNINGEALNKSVMEGVPYEETTLEECANVIKNYKSTFPGIDSYANEQISFARANGYVQTVFKHRRPIPLINHPNEWQRKKAENMCMNTPIQGSNADLMRFAMVNIQKEFRRRAKEDPRWNEVKMVMQIHDDIISECPAELAVEVARTVKSIMETPVNDLLRAVGIMDVDFDVPIVAEPAVGRVWANVLDIKFTENGGKVFIKDKKKEALDITLDDLTDEDLEAYRKAGIEVWMGEKRVA